MKSLKVVLVEDDLWLAKSYERLLASENIDVKHVTTAEVAIDSIDDEKPDIVIVDMLLEGGSSFALLHEMQSHDDMSGIPIIVMSASVESITGVNLSEYGVKTVLDKATLTPDELIASIRKLAV